MRTAFLPLCALVGALAATPALADVVTTCRSPAGKSIHLAGPTGWTDDSLPGASVTISNDRVSGYDVETRSAAGVATASGSGARIRRLLGDDSGALTLSVEYAAGTVEIYQLALDDKGNGTLLMAFLKNGAAGLTKGSLFTASCARP